MKQKYVVLFCLYFICVPFLFSQIVNIGILQIEPSETVYFGDEYTNKTTGIHNNNGDLYLNHNFINNGITSAISGTTFFNSTVNNIQTILGLTGSVNFYNLEINNSLTGVSVIDNFGLMVENAITLTNGNLRLVDDAQLIQKHAGTNANSSVLGKLLKDQQGYFSVYGYNHWSSPVNNGGSFLLNGGLFDGTDASINSFTPQQALFNTGSPYNGTPSVVDGGGNVITPLTINTTWLYKYTRGGIGNYADWIKIDENTPLNPGEGYLMKGTNTLEASQNYVFKGVPNSGDYIFPISTGESSLLGNPYPSAIDAHKLINDNLLLFDTLYFWVEGGSTTHNLSDYLGGYAIRNLTGGTPPSVASELIAGLGDAGSISPPTQYVAVGQGFFIEATGNGNIIFNNSQRVFKTESSGESNHYKNENLKITTANSYVRIGYQDPEGFHRQLLLGFLPNSPADLNYNPGYDSLIADLREDDLFYIIENDLSKKYVIQGVGDYNHSYEFSLGLIIAEEGTHTVMLDAVENFNEVVYIKDLVLNTTHNLSESNFNINVPIGEYLDRFQVVFKPAGVLSTNEFNNKKVNVYYNRNNSIVINNQNNLELKTVLVYNMLGQKILQVKDNLLGEKKIIIPFEHKKGLYLVIVKSANGKETFKIVN